MRIRLQYNGNQYSPNTTPCGSSGYGEVEDYTVIIQGDVAAPIADFYANKTSGCDNITVQFTDNSTNSPTSWLWTFGDGQTSTAQNPSHSYTAPGSYTVSLTATNAGGSNPKTVQGYIVVGKTPNISLSSTNATGGTANGTATVMVNNLTTYTVLWDYNNASTTTISGLAAGNYCVTVSDGNGCSTNACIEVENGSSNIDNIDYSIDIYPNPAHSVLNIKSSAERILQIELYDLSGRQIEHQRINTDEVKLDVSHLAPSSYVLKIVTEKESVVRKIIIN